MGFSELFRWGSRFLGSRRLVDELVRCHRRERSQTRAGDHAFFDPDAAIWQILYHVSIASPLSGGPSPRRRHPNRIRMSDQYRTSDLIQGKILAALPWEGGCKT